MGLIFRSNALGNWYGGKLVAAGEIDVTQMTRAILGPMLTSLAIGEALVFLPNVGEGFEAMDDLLDKLGDERSDSGTSLENKLLGNFHLNSMEFKKVDFSYPTRAGKILREFDLKLLLDGNRIALVGPSGGGKSTIVSLLLRLYEIDSGEIILNDSVDVGNLELHSYRDRIGYVGQEPVLFDLSLRDNVLYGIDREMDTDEETRLLTDLKEKARLDFLESIGGWETRLQTFRWSKTAGGDRKSDR